MSDDNIDFTLDDEELDSFQNYLAKYNFNQFSDDSVYTNTGTIKAILTTFSSNNTSNDEFFSKIYIAKISPEIKDFNQCIENLEYKQFEWNECGILLVGDCLHPTIVRHLLFELKEKWITFSFTEAFGFVNNLENPLFFEILKYPYTRYNQNPLVNWDGSDIYFYKKLIYEINTTFYYGNYTSAFILLRKLFENITIEILRNHFKTDTTKYYNPNSDPNKLGRFKGFQVLLGLFWRTFRSDLKSFTSITNSTDLNEIKSFIEEIRGSANATAHNIEIDRNKSDFDKRMINKALEFLKNIWFNIP